MQKKIKIHNKVNFRILTVLLILFSGTGLIVSLINRNNLRLIYEKSYTEKVLTSNRLMASLLNAEDIKYYVDLMNAQDDEFRQKQVEFNNNRELLFYLQENNAPIEEQEIVIQKMQDFHNYIEPYKEKVDENNVSDNGEHYAEILLQIKRLKEASNAKYVYVFAYTGVIDENNEKMMTFIFDAEDDESFNSPDSDGLGTVAYYEPVAFEIYQTKKAMETVDYYNQEPYGELYFAYAPILDYEGNVIAMVGTDLGLSEMNALISQRTKIESAIFAGILILIWVIIYFFLNYSVIKPLANLTNMALEIADGNIYSKVPESELKSNNELGLLAKAIDEMSSVYQEMVTKTSTLAQNANIGKLNTRNDVTNFKGDIAKVIERVNASLDAIVLYLNSVPESLFIMGSDLEIYFANTQYNQSFTGITAFEFIRIVLYEDKLVSKDSLKGKLFEKILDGQYVDNIWINNSCYSVIIKEVPLNDALENSILVIARDITALMKEKIKAQSANEAKSEFLSRVSHELRTPMNAIIGVSTIGLKSETEPSVVDKFQKIDTASKQLLNIINDVLDMSQIEAGKVEIINDAFNIRNILNDSVSLFCQLIKDKGLELELVIDDNVPEMIIGDAPHLKQIFVNIINNAIKFTEEGRISFTVTNLDIYNNTCIISFKIEDTGIGMSEEFLKKIFTPFEQESVYLQRKHKGTGLGLPISKNLANLMGGDITVMSVQNQGSIFNIIIPFEIVKIDNQEIAEKAFPTKNLEGLKVLLVDDIEINRMIFIEILSEHGLEIVEASDGIDAVRLFTNSSEFEFDMIFMDIQMTKMDGYEATKQIRQLKRADCNIPIIAMTANAMKQDVDKALASGMNEHVAKPIDYNMCLAIMNKYYKKKY